MSRSCFELGGLALETGSVLLFTSVGQGIVRTGSRIWFFTKHYGLAGLFIWCFGSVEVWRIQVQVLRSTNAKDAMDFKRATQDDSQIIALAATIAAQIAVTALSLTDLSQTHWVARAFFIFSLVSSIMAVYYATSQYRVMGRCLRAEQVKSWIAGKNRPTEATSSWTPEKLLSLPTFAGKTRPSLVARVSNPKKQGSRDPNLPSAASVLTVSAPNMLLSSSLHSFLMGLGVYVGCTWTRGLDEAAGADGSLAVFITYLVALIFCYGVYALSGAVVANESYVSERELLEGAKKDLLPTTNPTSEVSRGLGDDELGPTVSISMPDISQTDPEQQAYFHMPNGSNSGHLRDGRVFGDESTRQGLLRVFQEAANLRKKSAEVDERLVQILEKLR